MKNTRNLWPCGILLAFVLFISGTIALIVIACRNDSELVNADYYEQEIRFQKEIDGVSRARELAARVAYDPAQQRLLVTLPAAHAQNGAQGLIRLYRPSSAMLDRSIGFKPAAGGVQAIDAAGLQPGLWKVSVTWAADGTEFRVNEKFIIEAKRS